ncbi:MAG TPA: SMP-30/gluconolactonase/LRE family protein [Pyrinomonadaceae bacterium]|nr:SMP-30/gluconolactonase/LRE family protein [Pyrinomonadaceae bacterium]
MFHFKRLLGWAASVTVVLTAYLLFWPVGITPGRWDPPEAPSLTGPYEQNSRLATTERISLGSGFAPEDVAIDSSNRIYAGMDDGRIVRVDADGKRPHLFAETQGRPLGLAFDATGNLVVADAVKGLLSIASNGSITTLSIEAGGTPFGCTNDLDIAKNGMIYFTDASSKYPLVNYKADLLEHQPNGRLLAYNPADRTTRVILDSLHFANGVAVSPDQQFVLVNETGRYRVHRVWLTGDKRGNAELFIENLPGFPDGISSNGRDKFWLALVTPRDATLDRLLPHPFLRKAVLRLPKFLQPAPKRYSFVLGLDANGKVIHNLQDSSQTCYAQIANALEHNGSLYFGSIGESTIGRFALP